MFGKKRGLIFSHFTLVVLVVLIFSLLWVDSLMAQNEFINVKDFGAIGDGNSNDGAAIQAAINAAPQGSTIYLPVPSVNYKVTSTLTVSKPLNLVGDYSKIHSPTPNTTLFRITSSNVTIRRLKLTGTQYDNTNILENAIHIEGTSATSPLSNVRVTDNLIDLFGHYGIFLRFVTDFEVNGNIITNINYCGVMVISSQRGIVSQNVIRNLHGYLGNFNAYGIAISRDDGISSLEIGPRSSDIVVSANVVENVPTWTAYDTHAGQRIVFAGNTAHNSKMGIHVGAGDGTDTNSVIYAPIDVTVVGNTLDSGVTNGTASYGIVFAGVGELGVPTEKATGLISGNVVRGYGKQTDDTTGAIYVYNTQGLVISGNTIIEPSPIGINLYMNNYGVVVADNHIVDPWTTGTGFATAVSARAGYNKAHIHGNTFSRGGKNASRVLNTGIRVDNGYAGNSILLGINQSDATAYLDDPGGHSSTLTLKSNGQGGIGTVDPAAVWHVNSAMDTTYDPNNEATWKVMQISSNRTIENTARGIKFMGNNTNGETKEAGIVGIAKNTTGGAMALAFITAESNTSKERVRIEADGRVGIGTTTPAPGTSLHINSDIDTSVYNPADDATWKVMQISSKLRPDGNYSARGIKFKGNDADGNSGAGIVGIAKNGTGGVVALGFITAAGNLSQERMRITEDGDVAVTTQGNGLILRSTDGPSCFRLTVNNAGALSTSAVTCP